ncbi:hypothetical protein LTR36_003226 [Oleoguttula mirabilis]|uniref:BTB domain-containing protein n=1 Tax=Oleoguttula mirabilis TaxID=1507867 RepID=A0AAV9JX81_9PEZI|nr:hypothetical protein LTR36_003226 [Oleoguttula mirabilis]
MTNKEALESLVAKLAGLQGDEALTDFVIICGEREWKVHRVILTLHSPVLAKAITGAFKESAERQINLSEEHPDCVDALVCYAYKLQYSLPDAGQGDVDHLDSLSFHVKVCVLADKYDIPHLKQMAIEKFKAGIDVAAEDLATAAELAYDASPATEKIRERIVAFGIENKLLSTAGKTGISAVMGNNAEFARDYAQALESRLDKYRVATQPNEHRYHCPSTSCERTFVAAIPERCILGTFACYWCEKSFHGDRWQHSRVKG